MSLKGISISKLILPNIDNITPGAGSEGDSVTIAGTNFGPIQGSGVVIFGVIIASVVSWSDTSIVATVPTGSPGPVNVTVTTSLGTSSGFSFTRTPPPGPLVLTFTSPSAYYSGDNPIRNPGNTANITYAQYAYNSMTSNTMYWVGVQPNTYNPNISFDITISGSIGLSGTYFGVGRANSPTYRVSGFYYNNGNFIETDSGGVIEHTYPITLVDGDVLNFEMGGWQYGQVYIAKNGSFFASASDCSIDIFVYKV